jgi:hypothetical protein
MQLLSCLHCEYLTPKPLYRLWFSIAKVMLVANMWRVGIAQSVGEV